MVLRNLELSLSQLCTRFRSRVNFLESSHVVAYRGKLHKSNSTIRGSASRKITFARIALSVAADSTVLPNVSAFRNYPLFFFSLEGISQEICARLEKAFDGKVFTYLLTTLRFLDLSLIKFRKDNRHSFRKRDITSFKRKVVGRRSNDHVFRNSTGILLEDRVSRQDKNSRGNKNKRTEEANGDVNGRFLDRPNARIFLVLSRLRRERTFPFPTYFH